jgi:hypothetical protein
LTLEDKLDDLLDTKEAIRQAMIKNGANVPESTPFSQYAGKIASLICSGSVPGEGDPFKITLTGMAASDKFSFKISASGEFNVDWGDETAVQTITKSNTSNTTYSHTYTSAGNYVVTLTGLATGYDAGLDLAAVSFDVSTNNKTKMTKIEGDLGSIFPILNTTDAGKPKFLKTFLSCTGLTSIPENLFAGLKGEPGERMFYNTFEKCGNITSIPQNLFAGIKGAPSKGMFMNTFAGCNNITGAVPHGFFGSISGAPAEFMFSGALSGTGLTDISGGFENCEFTPGSANKSLFNAYYLPDSMTATTQARNSASPADKNGVKLYDWDNQPAGLGTFHNNTSLSDFASIPEGMR